MPFSTYAELKAAIPNAAGWAKRSDILTLVDDFIDLAEADMWQTLRTRDMETLTTGTLGTSDRFLALPSNFLEMRKFRFTAGGVSYELIYNSPESLRIVAGAGRPKHYTITSQIEMERVPDSAYAYEIQHYQQLTPLSSSNTSNAILSRFPSIYLFGTVYHCAVWAMNDPMAVKYSTLFADAMERANNLDRRGRRGAAKAMRVEGSTP